MIVNPPLDEANAEFDRLLNDELKRPDRSYARFAFTWYQHRGEKDLHDNPELLQLYQKTRFLSDYRRDYRQAEAGVRRGWERWVELEYGAGQDAVGDVLKFHQCLMLYKLRRAPLGEPRVRILREYATLCHDSADTGDTAFFRRLADALDEQPPGGGQYSFVQMVLANWLTAFWWLLPLEAVADDIIRADRPARLQSAESAKDYATQKQKILSALKHLHRGRGQRGGYFSKGWTGCFYSARPPLIDWIEADGTPHLTNPKTNPLRPG